jgi:hypothetical protein
VNSIKSPTEGSLWGPCPTVEEARDHEATGGRWAIRLPLVEARQVVAVTLAGDTLERRLRRLSRLGVEWTRMEAKS